jgi:hypothetical protein
VEVDEGGKAFTIWESNVADHLLSLMIKLHVLNQASNILVVSFNFVTANFMLPDRTVTLVSSACIEMAVLFSFSYK